MKYIGFAALPYTDGLVIAVLLKLKVEFFFALVTKWPEIIPMCDTSASRKQEN